MSVTVGKQVTSIGKQPLKGISPKAVIQVPKKKKRREKK